MIDPKQLERTILLVLADQPANVMQPQPTLHNEVMARLNRGVTNADFEARLIALQNKNQIIGVSGDDYTRWKISPNGHARLAELRTF